MPDMQVEFQDMIEVLSAQRNDLSHALAVAHAGARNLERRLMAALKELEQRVEGDAAPAEKTGQ